jgi:TonB family protein
MRKLSTTCVGIFLVLAFCVVAFGQDTPKTIKGGVLNRKAISLPHPEYPEEARSAGREGTVAVDVVIDESGSVVSAVAQSILLKSKSDDPAVTGEGPEDPIDTLLCEAAEKAALEARFSPTFLSGVPVKISGSIVYNFVLSSASRSAFNGGILNGKATNLPAPIYPDTAKAVRARGNVVVRITIDEHGDVIEASAVSGHPLLRAAAVQAATEAKFAPTTLGGQPVKVSGMLTYNFELRDGTD